MSESTHEIIVIPINNETLYPDLEVESAGLAPDAEVVLAGEMLVWAELIFVMEPRHQRLLNKKFGSWLKGKRVICLDIADEYDYLQPELIALLKQRVLPRLGKA